MRFLFEFELTTTPPLLNSTMRHPKVIDILMIEKTLYPPKEFVSCFATLKVYLKKICSNISILKMYFFQVSKSENTVGVTLW